MSRQRTRQRPSPVRAPARPRHEVSRQALGNQALVEALQQPDKLSVEHVATLQRQAGNAAVQSVLTGTVPVQRMAVAGTRWSAATSARITASGAGGAAILDDGSGPVVVKTGEVPGPELVIASQLLSDVGQREEDELSVAAPMARVAGDEESQQIGATLRDLLPPAADTGQQRRYDNFIDRLSTPYTMVYAYAPGRDYQDILAEQKQTRSRRLFGFIKRSSRKPTMDSAVRRLATEGGQMRALGRAAAVDIFTSNRDRLIGSVNLENFRFDAATGTFAFLDNIDLRDSSFVRNVEEFKVDVRDAFNTWISFGRNETRNFAADQFEPIARDVMEHLIDAVGSTVRAKDARATRKIMTANRAGMERYFADGLRRGKQSILAALSDVRAFASLFAEPDRETALTALAARKYFLQGIDRDMAWDLAAAEAEMMMRQQRQAGRWVPGRRSLRGRRSSLLSRR